MSSLAQGSRAPLGANDAAQQLRRAVIAATVGTSIIAGGPAPLVAATLFANTTRATPLRGTSLPARC